MLPHWKAQGCDERTGTPQRRLTEVATADRALGAVRDRQLREEGAGRPGGLDADPIIRVWALPLFAAAHLALLVACIAVAIGRTAAGVALIVLGLPICLLLLGTAGRAARAAGKPGPAHRWQRAMPDGLRQQETERQTRRPRTFQHERSPGMPKVVAVALLLFTAGAAGCSIKIGTGRSAPPAAVAVPDGAERVAAGRWMTGEAARGRSLPENARGGHFSWLAAADGIFRKAWLETHRPIVTSPAHDGASPSTASARIRSATSTVRPS